MSDLTDETTTGEEGDLPLERGAGLAAMKDRSASVAPPPRPVAAPAPPSAGGPPTTADDNAVPGAAAPTEEAKLQPTQREKAPKKSTGAKAAKTTSRDDDELIGRQKGQLRHITVRIPLGLRQRLDTEAGTVGQSLGEAAMDQVRAHHRQLREAFQQPVEDGFAAPRRKRKRSADGTKQQTGLFITPEEAKALQDLADEVMMSVSLTIEECLRRAWPDA